jgi:hypothetical protein
VSRGFIQIRSGLSEHLLNGALDAFTVSVYLIILMQVDFETGVWTDSAARLLASAPRGASLRDMQRALELLEKIGFIRIFHRHGQRGNYRALINKYEPKTGALTGKRLNAAKSDDWRHPVYEVCAVLVAEDGTDTDAVPVAEAAPYLEVEKDLDLAKKQRLCAPAATAGAAQPVAFQSSVLVVTQSHDAKLGDTYPWVDRPQEYKKMSFWREANCSGRKVRSPLAFCQNWFNRIPKPTNGKGGMNGNGNRNQSFAEQRSQESAAAIEKVLGRFEKEPGDFRRALPSAGH